MRNRTSSVSKWYWGSGAPHTTPFWGFAVPFILKVFFLFFAFQGRSPILSFVDGDVDGTVLGTCYDVSNLFHVLRKRIYEGRVKIQRVHLYNLLTMVKFSTLTTNRTAKRQASRPEVQEEPANMLSALLNYMDTSSL